MRSPEQLLSDTAPFSDKVIKSVPPRGEAYVSWPHYTQRLLMAHGPHRYTVTSVVSGLISHEIGGGTLEVTDGWAVTVRIQIGEDEWYDGVGEGHNPTAAESNAYKRACAHAGIGLHLYSKHPGDYWLHGVLSVHPEEIPEPLSGDTKEEGDQSSEEAT